MLVIVIQYAIAAAGAATVFVSAGIRHGAWELSGCLWNGSIHLVLLPQMALWHIHTQTVDTPLTMHAVSQMRTREVQRHKTYISSNTRVASRAHYY